MPLRSFPLNDPDTGAPLDNLLTVDETVLDLFRARGMSDEELRFHSFKIDVPDEEIEAAFVRARKVLEEARADVTLLRLPVSGTH